MKPYETAAKLMLCATAKAYRAPTGKVGQSSRGLWTYISTRNEVANFTTNFNVLQRIL